MVAVRSMLVLCTGNSARSILGEAQFAETWRLLDLRVRASLALDLAALDRAAAQAALARIGSLEGAA